MDKRKEGQTHTCVDRSYGNVISFLKERSALHCVFVYTKIKDVKIIA